MDNLNAQIGPIYAVYPDNKELNDLVGLVSEETGKVSQETQVVVRNISALYQQVNSFKGIE